MLRNAYKQGCLKLTNKLKHIKNYSAFNSWLDLFYNKKWVVHLSKPTDNHKRNIEYLGRYIKRPPLAESRILGYDDKSVTFAFFDHHSNEHETKTLGRMEFIERIINHIPDKGFHLIRYYGFLANRVQSKMIEIVDSLIGSAKSITKKIPTKWRELMIANFGKDPLQCKSCQQTMRLTEVKSPISSFDLLGKVEELFSPMAAFK